MKLKLLFLSVTVLTALEGIYAQPTISGTNWWVPGDVFTNQWVKVEGVAPGSAGANQTWDFSGLIDSGNTESVHVLAPSSTPSTDASYFPGANLAALYINGVGGGDSNYEYFTSSATVGDNDGGVTDSSHTVFSTPIIQLEFPLTYGDSWSGPIVGTYTSGAITGNITGTDSSWADGWGTLIMPARTYTGNVIRVHSVWTQDISVSGFSFSIHYSAYDYMIPGYNFFIFEIATTSTTVSGFTSSVTLALRAKNLPSGFDSVPPVAVTDTATVVQPGSVTIHVLANDINNNPSDTVCVNQVWGTPSGWETIQGCSDVVFHPLDSNFTGLDTFYYRSCYLLYPTLCDTGMVIVSVEAAGSLQAGFMSTGGECGSEMLINQSVNASSFTWYLSETSPGTFDTAISNIDTVIPFNLGPQFQNSTYNVCITAYAGSDSVNICDTTQFICTGINEITASEYKIYPNPASDMIQVDISHIDRATMASISDIVVYDMMGQKLKDQPISQTSVSVGDLGDGVYMVGLVDKSGNRKILGKFDVLR